MGNQGEGGTPSREGQSSNVGDSSAAVSAMAMGPQDSKPLNAPSPAQSNPLATGNTALPSVGGTSVASTPRLSAPQHIHMASASPQSQPSMAALLNASVTGAAPNWSYPLLSIQQQPSPQLMALLDPQQRAMFQRQLELQHTASQGAGNLNVSFPSNQPQSALAELSRAAAASAPASSPKITDGRKIPVNESEGGSDAGKQFKLDTPEPDGPEPFPQKLYRMLQDAEKAGYSEIVCWMPSGETFSILDNYKFIRHVSPNFFQHSKMSSFTRQLQLYNFRRVVENGNVDCYKHSDFKKDKPELLHHIRRTKRKKVTSAKTD